MKEKIPNGVIGIFHRHNLSDRTMVLGSTQPLTGMSTRRISCGKCGRCVRLTSLPPFGAVVTKSGKLNFLKPSGSHQVCSGTALPLSLRFTCIGISSLVRYKSVYVAVVNKSRYFSVFVVFHRRYLHLYLYTYYSQFHLHHSVNIYSNWLQEQFCNISLYTLYTLSVQQISLQK
jgi:hypothetical protein